MFKLKISFYLIILTVSLLACKKSEPSKSLAFSTSENKLEATQPQKENLTLSSNFKSYWYNGDAEITSYKLEQARYGELRQGTAVLVYVTEDFDKNLQVKADYPNASNIPVLKLNASKNFNTGVYPYSIMQSTFYPVANNQHALKVSCSVQEWCGHVYAQLNNRKQFQIKAHSYFQSEADQDFKLDKAILENELWLQLRIDPTSLPTGQLDIIPSFEFMRLKHVEIKSYKANAELNNGLYSINYPDLNRSLVIQYNTDFPYDIIGWKETFKSGFGPNAKLMTTKGTKLKTIKSAYWSKNHNSDEVLRSELMLD